MEAEVLYHDSTCGFASAEQAIDAFYQAFPEKEQEFILFMEDSVKRRHPFYFSSWNVEES
jgi:hypothetical protein